MSPSQTRPRVYITQPVSAAAVERLRAAADVTINPDMLHIARKDELIAAARSHDAIFCLLHDRIDCDVIAANPKLKVIASTTVTPADIDVAEATRHGIPVTAVPSSLLDDATADLAWALLFAVGRRVVEADRLARAGVIPGSQSNFLAASGISGKTLGILGLGGVGRAMARRASGFPMKRCYFDTRRLKPEDEASLGLVWLPFDELLASVDYLSIHVNLNPNTRHLIGARELALMKPTAHLINTARGPLIDENALIAALHEGRIAGAGLDVFEHEPGIDPMLLGMPNVVVTPHMGSAVESLREAMAAVAVDNILAVINGRPAPNCWNPEVYSRTA
jgi:glyoxylate reductase